jgi:beta-glucosidase
MTTTESVPFRDPELPLDARVADLLGRLTVEEKVGQMLHDAQAIERLGIPAYNYWNEALHGVARNGRATVFPQAILMAASWDTGLIQRVADAIADEGRAKYHAAIRKHGYSQQYQGLTFWSPNINIFRDPRWGRGQETWGEDPFLTGEMGAAFVRGLQGDDPRYLKTAACAKHFAVHSGPEKERHEFDARVQLRDLWQTYLPAFRKLVVETKVEVVMGAYNRILGEPCCASRLLLQDILRSTWGFQGHVVSDCWALTDFHKNHHVTDDPVESAALALRRGCDLSCGCTYDLLGEALGRGLISEAELDTALARHLRTRFKLGLFDPPERVPYAAIPVSVVACEKHRELAHEAAVKSIVLLRNADNILPLKPDLPSLLLVGPHATNGEILLGNYSGVPATMTTLLEGITARVPEGVRFDYRMGCEAQHPNLTGLEWSVFEAKRNEVVIACLGLTPQMEGEEGDAIASSERGDRADIALHPIQHEYLQKLVDTGSKVVVVLVGGSAVALGDLAEKVSAILWIGYPGQEGGRALAELIFGDRVPSGKLPVTFYKSVSDLPPYSDYSMAGRTYRYFEGEPEFPFGFGLSYTRFTYESLSLSTPDLKAGQSLQVSVRVRNVGSVAGDEVVQCYLADIESSVPTPRESLVAFERISLLPGEAKELAMSIPPEAFVAYDEQGRPFFEAGDFRVTVGGCSPGPRGQALGAPVAVSSTLTLTT